MTFARTAPPRTGRSSSAGDVGTVTALPAVTARRRLRPRSPCGRITDDVAGRTGHVALEEGGQSSSRDAWERDVTDQQPYTPGGGGQPPAPLIVRQQTNGMAIAALVIGILSLVACGPIGILAIIFGTKAKSEIRNSNGTQSGEGMAQAGWICGLIALVMWGLIIGLILAATLLGKSASYKFSSVGSSLS
jgi:hypothetical protein